MKLFVMISVLFLGLTANAWADVDSGSEASVAAHSFDPTKEDCKCLQPKKVKRPLDNEANDKQVVGWITDPAAPGPAPAIGTEK